MKESSYKHNYEYLSIEEAKSIVNGTFVHGTTNIGGELVTKSDINKLLTTADKKLTSIVPPTVTDNEFVCFFECISNELFPDDVTHRWIEVSPIQFTFPADGGSVKITGSYGLTGTLGTRKKVGDINDTITADANATPSSKSGSKTYYYNNNLSLKPTAKVSWTQPNKSEEFPDDQAHRWIRVQPTSSQVSVDGGTIRVTGSYGLTGTYGTEKKVGDITDTIVVERNSTLSPKSGSKTYHYNNNQTDNPTATITWTQPGRAEEFPDDQAHRWINISPTQFDFPADGGSVKITGSYGLTGTLGTRKEVGTISDTITVEVNNTESSKSGSKTYYYNNDQSLLPTINFSWTQQKLIFTYKYKIGFVETPESTDITSYKTVVWQSDLYEEAFKKKVYVKASRLKVNSSNLVVSSEDYHFVIDNGFVGDFSVNVLQNALECYPTSVNTDYNNKKISKIKCLIQEDKDVFCELICIQELKGILVVSGDAIMFTYNWDDGRDLDLATFVNLNLKNDNDSNYAGFLGVILSDYKNILYFAGDNTGKGNEYSFVDFKEIYKYLKTHGSDLSSIDGKNILLSLTDDNGLICVTCDLYTNWYIRKSTENITLSYSIYNKGENSSVDYDYDNKTFILTGYTMTKKLNAAALCYAQGTYNPIDDNAKNTYTLSAKLKYYFNSNTISFLTNEGNVSKWQLGYDLDKFELIQHTPQYSNVQFSKDNDNVSFYIKLDSLKPDYFCDTNVRYYYYIRQVGKYYVLKKPYSDNLSNVPFIVSDKTKLSDVIENADFEGSDSIVIYPTIDFDETVDYDKQKRLLIASINLLQSYKLNILKIN